MRLEWLQFLHHLLISPLVSLTVCFCVKMERSVRLFSTVVLVLLLLFATEMRPMAVEARICESQSHKFKGACVRRSNCAAVCQTEGFPGGHCRGFRRRCFCSKIC